MPLEQVSRFSSVVITPVSGAAITVTDIKAPMFKVDPEVLEEYTGDSVDADIYIGNANVQVGFETGDMAVFMGMVKGLRVSSVVLTGKGPHTGVTAPTGAQTAQHNKVVTATLTNAYVMEALELQGNEEGRPSRFRLIFKSCKAANGAPSTFNVTFAGGGGGGNN